jgi:hypothetical protein
MRLFSVLPLLSLLLGGRASLESRDPIPHRLDVRATSNLCATINLYIPYLSSFSGLHVGGSNFNILWPSVPVSLSD